MNFIMSIWYYCMNSYVQRLHFQKRCRDQNSGISKLKLHTMNWSTWPALRTFVCVTQWNHSGNSVHLTFDYVWPSITLSFDFTRPTIKIYIAHSKWPIHQDFNDITWHKSVTTFSRGTSTRTERSRSWLLVGRVISKCMYQFLVQQNEQSISST